MVVRVGEDGLALFEEAVYKAGPPAQVFGPVLFGAGVPRGKLAAIPESANVGEACGRFFKPGHPRVVDEGEGRPMLAQHFREVRVEPAPVAHFDGV